jgi:hypothetical protein
MAIHRGNHWTPEEDQRLLELIGSGKSWMLISALLKRSQLSIKERARYLKRRSASQAARLEVALPRDKVKAPARGS